MRHGAGQAVFVDGEDVDGHIAEQVVDVHIIFQGITFRNVFESSDHALVVGLCGICDLAVPDGLVAVQLIVCIIEVRAASAHGEAALAAAKAEIVRRTFSGGGRFLFRRRGIPIRRGHVAKIQIAEIHIIGLEITAGFSPAADVHAVRLIELAVLHAIIAEQEAVLHGLEREIDAPVFAVDGEFGIIRAEILVHIVDQRLFHVGSVGIVVVQDELIQTEAGLAVHIVAKFQLEAVAVGRGVIGDGGRAGVALGADGDAVKGRTADLDVALVIFLRRGVGQHIVPVGLVHADIDLEHAARIEQRRLIRHGDAGLPCRCRDWTGKRGCAQAEADGSRHACGDDSRADDRQRDHARTDDNAHRERPEQEHDLDRLLDGRAEADDGQRAHHAERQDHVARDGHNDQRGDKGQAHQRQREAAGIQHAGQRFLVDVVECHGSSSCFLTEPAA